MNVCSYAVVSKDIERKIVSSSKKTNNEEKLIKISETNKNKILSTKILLAEPSKE